VILIITRFCIYRDLKKSISLIYLDDMTLIMLVHA